MNEILKMLNELSADELDSVILRANIILEKKRKDEAEAAEREKERQRQEMIEKEKRRQEEIAALQRRLQELQNQQTEATENSKVVFGDNYIMYDKPKPADRTQAAEPKAAPVQNTAPKTSPVQNTAPKAAPAAQSAKQIFCTQCGTANTGDSLFCENCGKRLSAPKPQTAPQKQTAQVRYADESEKKWEMRPGEKIVRSSQDVVMIQPCDKKYAYYMEVTNQRILFSREKAGSRNATVAASMGGGLVGALIADRVKAATGAGPKPWVEIPLAAVVNCGIQNRKEYFIVADQIYVMKNKGFEKFLPELVAEVKFRRV